MKKMLRKDRYKLVYRVVKNEFQDTKLAKRAQSWSDDTLERELGIKLSSTRMPRLKKIKTDKQRDFYKRKKEHFDYGVEQGLTSVEALDLAYYSEKNIRLEKQYQRLMKRSKMKLKPATRFKHYTKLKKIWGEWSDSGMPPSIRRQAQILNASVKRPSGSKKFDINAKYGYVYMFYKVVEGRSDEDIRKLVTPNIHDEYRVRYTSEIEVIQ